MLALQGDFADHQAALERRGLRTRQVRVPADLHGVSALVLPGGESTTMLRLLDLQGLRQPLLDGIDSGLPVLATCAGLILLAREVTDPVQSSLGRIDCRVQRNGYGRQIASGTFPLTGELPVGSTGIFIRAPRVTAVGPEVRVLARRDGDPVLLEQGAILGCCFHPELEPGPHPVIERFVARVRGEEPAPAKRRTLASEAAAEPAQ